MAKCLVAHGTLPFPTTHVGAHPFNMSCQVAEGSKDLAALSTSIPLCDEKDIYTLNLYRQTR